MENVSFVPTGDPQKSDISNFILCLGCSLDSRIAQMHNSRSCLSVNEVFWSHYFRFCPTVSPLLFFSIDKANSRSLLSLPSRDGATISPRWSFVSTLQAIAWSVGFRVLKVPPSDFAARYECLLSVFVEGAKPNHPSAAWVCKGASCRAIPGFGLFGLGASSM